MKVAWCYIRQSDNVGCFKMLRPKSTMRDWIKGHVLKEKVMLEDLNYYNVFVSDQGEVWYYSYEATVSFKNPRSFIRF